jgi:hypothetical protein
LFEVMPPPLNFAISHLLLLHCGLDQGRWV